MASSLQIRKYCTRVPRCHPVHGNVHIFVNGQHDKKSLLASDKRILTATLYNNSSGLALDSFSVILASANELASEYIISEVSGDCEAEVQPLTVAKHLADVTGMDLIVVDTVYCDSSTSDTLWDVYYLKSCTATRHALSRSILTDQPVM